MSLIVQKYGGTSVGSPDRILNVARRVIATHEAGHGVVVVVSAMSGVTDGLIKLARQISENPDEREMDVLLSTGEQTTTALTAMAIRGLGMKAVSLTGGQAGIITDGVHTKAKIANISPKQIHRHLKDDYIVIVAGFQGETTDGHRGQRSGCLLSGRKEDVHLTLIGVFRNLPGELDEAVGHPAHRRHDDDYAVTGFMGGDDAPGHIQDAIRAADGRAAIFLNDEAHQGKGVGSLLFRVCLSIAEKNHRRKNRALRRYCVKGKP